jgi:cytochrome c oxidase cbb3-type subunit I/II
MWALERADRSAGAAEALQESAALMLRGRQVYAANCAICHGVNGDGNGTAAHMFGVRPRDFRQGIFKFRSTLSGSLPADDDLVRTVTQGLRWTGMVGRPDLTDADRRAVVQYLKTFSPRFREEQVPASVTIPRAPAMNPALVENGRRAY